MSLNLAPKVHPLTRQIEADDPMELIAEPTVGDPELMLDSLLHEYAMLGWPPDALLELFRNPMYPVLRQLADHFGLEAVRGRIAALMGDHALVRFVETIDPIADDGDEDSLPTVFQVGLADSMQAARKD